MEKAKRLKMTEETSESSSPEEVFDMSEISTRRIRPSDADDFLKWALDDEVNRFRPWVAFPSREDVADYIENEGIHQPWSKVICIKNKAIGAISVTPNSENYDKCRAELGFCLEKKYWSKGIMTKVVQMLINSTIFQEWKDLKRLEATVEVNNIAAQRVLEKAGFQREAVLRKYRILKGRAVDIVMFSFISSDLHLGSLLSLV